MYGGFALFLYPLLFLVEYMLSFVLFQAKGLIFQGQRKMKINWFENF